jgi:uncharacterized membrane-anchored protein
MDVYGYPDYLFMGLFFSVFVGFPVWALLTYVSYRILSWRKSFGSRPRTVKVLLALGVSLVLWVAFLTVTYQLQGDSAGNRLL